MDQVLDALQSPEVTQLPDEVRQLIASIPTKLGTDNNAIISQINGLFINDSRYFDNVVYRKKAKEVLQQCQDIVEFLSSDNSGVGTERGRRKIEDRKKELKIFLLKVILMR